MGALPVIIVPGQTGHISHHIDLHTRFNTWIDVQDPDYGAKGNGSAGDDVHIQAALNAAAPGSCVSISKGPSFYSCQNAMTISTPMTVLGVGLPDIRITVDNKGLFDVLPAAVSDVRIEGLKLTGHQFATVASSGSDIEFGVRCTGTSGTTPFLNFTVQHCVFSTFGDYAVYADRVLKFDISHNPSIDSIGYCGVALNCSVRGAVEHNDIDMNSPNGAGSSHEAYGIFASRDNNDSLTTSPRCAYVSIAHNNVQNVPLWEGYDTHGGLAIRFESNGATNVNVGIVCGPSKNSSNVVAFAPLRCVLQGNTLDSNVNDGSRYNGIIVEGAVVTVGSPVQRATDCVVAGNVIVGFGTQSDTHSGGIYSYGTHGLAITGNTIREPSPWGIVLDYDNAGATITGNTVTDPWTSGAGGCGGVALRSGTNTGAASGNTFETFTKSATHVLQYGFRAFNAAGQHLVLGANECTGHTVNYAQDDNAGNHSFSGPMLSFASTWDPANIANGASVTSGNIDPTISGSYVAGDRVDVSVNPALADGLFATAKVAASGFVKITVGNLSGGAVDPPSATYTVTVTRP